MEPKVDAMEKTIDQYFSKEKARREGTYMARSRSRSENTGRMVT